jgi:hypothetical protein
MSEWINVKDDLPAQNQRVIVYRGGWSISMTTYHDGEFILESNHHPVTHWMPPPYPPK